MRLASYYSLGYYSPTSAPPTNLSRSPTSLRVPQSLHTTHASIRPSKDQAHHHLSTMSKRELALKIVNLLKTLPKENIKHYASFKDVQIERFSNMATVETISEKDLKLQYASLRDLVNDKYKNYYKVDDKLTKPKGNPQYYDRLMSEIRGEKKETLATAVKTVVFGK